MRKRWRYDKETKELIPLEDWLRKYDSRTGTHHVIPDIKPYMAVAGDMAGKWISSRKEHREFLRRNGFEEVGNEKSYMMRNNGMAEDNPNTINERRREEQICRSLSKTLEQLRNR